MTVLHVDIETRSRADLTKIGVYAYAEHESTEITMVAYAFDDSEPRIWYPPISTRDDWGGPIPPEFSAAMADASIRKMAHNAGFERILTTYGPGQRIGIPHTDREHWDCTAARAASMGLPRSLDGAGAALGLQQQKDAEGSKLMRLMMRPHKPTKKDPRIWIDDDVTILRVGEYCIQDVRAEQAICAKLPPLRAEERETWLLTEEMNDRGVLIDTKLLASVLFMVEEAEDAVMAEIRQLTGCICGDGWRRPLPTCGAAHGLHHSYITKWLCDAGLDDDLRQGDGSLSVGKAIVSALLERDDLNPLARVVLHLRQENGGTAAKKYTAILNRMSRDNRLRGVMQYCGAASTGRWCLAEGTPVLVKTVEGRVENKSIETVRGDDLVWDGDSWVKHEGVVFSGVKEVISYGGVTASVDHVVYISDTESMPLAEARQRGVALFRGKGDPWSA